MIERQLSFAVASYSLDAVQRAAYTFSDRLSSEVTPGHGEIRCVLYLPAGTDDDVEATLADFRNEVLDQTLRERIRSETEEVRNLILALAFSRTGLVDATDA